MEFRTQMLLKIEHFLLTTETLAINLTQYQFALKNANLLPALCCITDFCLVQFFPAMVTKAQLNRPFKVTASCHEVMIYWYVNCG